MLQILLGIFLGTSCLSAFLSSMDLTYSIKDGWKGSFPEGFFSLWNQIVDRLGEANYALLPKLAGGMNAAGEALEHGLELTLLMLLSILLAWLILASGNRILLLLVIIPVLLPMIGAGLYPGRTATLAWMTALLLASTWMNGRRGIHVSIFLLPLLALVFTVAGMQLIDHTLGFNQPKPLAKVSISVNDALQERYGSNALTNGKLDLLTGERLKAERGSLSQVKASLEGKKTSGETALEVTMEKATSLYLKGFTGDRYEDSRWSKLENADYYAMREQQYWLNRQGFDGLSQIATASKVAGAEQSGNKLSIRVVNADRSHIYVPYELQGSAETLPEGTKDYAGVFAGSDRIFGSSEYSYVEAGDLCSRWTDWVARLFSGKQKTKIEKYLINESHFNRFVYEKYTDLPKELRKAFVQELGPTGDLRQNHADYSETISLVRRYLKDRYIYTDNVKVDEGDALLTFMKSRKGCDMQFASLATLLFRHYGIPARYVEGYLVTPADVKSAKSKESIRITRDHIHAWTEIYIDGFGFVPLEVTPDYQGIMKEADLTRGLEAVAYESSLDSKSQSQKKETEKEKKSISYTGLIKRVFLWILGVLLTGILILLLDQLIRHIRISLRWRRAFRDPDPKLGAAALFRYIRQMGLLYGEEARRIGQKAIYSEERITEKERTYMYEEMKRGKHEKKKRETVTAHLGKSGRGLWLIGLRRDK